MPLFTIIRTAGGSGCRAILLILVFFCCLITFGVRAQVADPVEPCLDFSFAASHFALPLIPDDINMEGLMRRRAVRYSNWSAVTNADKASNAENRILGKPKNDEDIRTYVNYLNGTTYWLNEFLHPGHLFYDLVMVQVFQLMRFDQIIVQRSACHGMLCAGIGSIDSFYKGFFAALFKASNHPPIPVFVRWAREKSVIPLYFSADTPNYYFEPPASQKRSPIYLHNWMWCESVVARTGTNFGEIPTVSVAAVKKFKTAAYSLIRTKPALTTHFTSLGPPYRILLSYRANNAKRQIANLKSLENSLRTNFPAPDYDVQLLDNSNPQLDFQTQIKAVAEAHVVITNHGAFESNVVYMRNSSLLLEIFGHYGNNEIHQFHRTALMWGVFYGRTHARSLTNHHMHSFTMTDADILDVVQKVKRYFEVKPFRHNLDDNEMSKLSSVNNGQQAFSSPPLGCP